MYCVSLRSPYVTVCLTNPFFLILYTLYFSDIHCHIILLLYLLMLPTSAFLSTSCCAYPFFPQCQLDVIGSRKWIRERLLTQHHPFLLVWVFLWDCHWLLAAGYKDILRGIAMHFPIPDSRQILITFRPSPKPWLWSLLKWKFNE